MTFDIELRNPGAVFNIVLSTVAAVVKRLPWLERGALRGVLSGVMRGGT
jgi:hypothetical protein